MYVHVPFCARRCVYCDFSIAVRSDVPARQFVDAVVAEFARHDSSRTELATLYFGGGTPSKLGPALADLIAAITSRVRLNPDAEVTVEANPEDVSRDIAARWKEAGANRVSLGVQSFDDRALEWMHRTHDSKAAQKAVEVLRDVGLHNISIDLIFALPVRRSWRADLERAIALRLPHLSVYGLTVETHTPLGKWVARRTVAEQPEDVFEDQFLASHDAFTSAGFDHYEVSNFALPGQRSRHNSAYWQRQPYIGVGPSAHEFDGSARRWNIAPYTSWLARVASGADPVSGCETLTPDQIEAEKIYLGLRTDMGIDVVEGDRAVVDPWVEAGWARWSTPTRLHLTALGWLRLDALATALTAFRSRY